MTLKNTFFGVFLLVIVMIAGISLLASPKHARTEPLVPDIDPVVVEGFDYNENPTTEPTATPAPVPVISRAPAAAVQEYQPNPMSFDSGQAAPAPIPIPEFPCNVPIMVIIGIVLAVIDEAKP